MPSASPEKNRLDVALFRQRMKEKGYQQMNFWIRTDLRQALIRKADNQQRTLNDVVNEALRRDIDLSDL
jgi:predicted HicB family RNase H-like nuclease